MSDETNPMFPTAPNPVRLHRELEPESDGRGFRSFARWRQHRGQQCRLATFGAS